MHPCTSVCEHAHVCAAQMDSNRQHFQEHVPTVLIAAACGSYKYSNSRTKIGIYALLHLQKSLHQEGKTGSSKHHLQSTSPAPAGLSSQCSVPAPGRTPTGLGTQPLRHHVPLTLCVRPYPHAPRRLCQPVAISAGVQISRPWWKRGCGQLIGEETTLGEVSWLGTAARLLPASLLSSSWCGFPELLLAWFERTSQWEGAPSPTEPPA